MCSGHESHTGGWRRHDRPGRWGRHRHAAGFCSCGHTLGFGRRFWAKEEIVAWLERYLEDLRKEAKAVEERLAEMKAE